MKKDSTIFLRHILDEITKIENSTKEISRTEFKKELDIHDAVIRRIEIIGEAAKNLPKTTKDNHPEIEWKKIAGTRDVLIHAYFSIDLDLVWGIVKRFAKAKKTNTKYSHHHLNGDKIHRIPGIPYLIPRFLSLFFS